MFASAKIDVVQGKAVAGVVDVEANRVAQRELYGAPLGDVLERCRSVLGLTQARLAAALGISAPMLSQVISAQRIKIANPAAVRRLQVMVDSLAEVESHQLTVDDVLSRVEAEGGSGEVLTGSTRRVSSREIAIAVQSMFRQVASATDYLAAADQLAETYPDVADLLRVYGAGRLDEATACISRTQS